MDNTNYTETGNLVVNVRTAGGAIPIEGAVVTVYANKNGEPIRRVTTDRSGVTPLIGLGTPPRELTMQPGSEQKPYAEYDIITEANGYYSVRNIGLPVYSGVTSIQPVELIPLADKSGREYTPTNDTRFNESIQPNL